MPRGTGGPKACEALAKASSANATEPFSLHPH